MKVSIIIPTANERPQFLQQTIKSIENQSYKNKEIIIIEDKEKRGISWAMNQGIKKAGGILICAIHDDDILYNNKSLDIRINEFKKDETLEVLYTSAMDIDENGQDIKKYTMKPLNVSELWKGDNGIYMPTMMWRKSIHDKIGYFSEDLISNEDYEFKIKCAMECVMKGIDIITVGYRRHSGQKSTINAGDIMRMYERKLKERLKGRYIHLWN